MKTAQRESSGETDIQAMIGLARVSPADNLHVVDLPCRVSSWALDDPDNVGLWVNCHETPQETDYALLAFGERHTNHGHP
jgi:hypothetical protein